MGEMEKCLHGRDDSTDDLDAPCTKSSSLVFLAAEFFTRCPLVQPIPMRALGEGV
jgi:hypothetical protein